jgi:hypothetical protein
MGVLEVIRQTALQRLPVPPSPSLPHKGGGSRHVRAKAERP